MHLQVGFSVSYLAGTSCLQVIPPRYRGKRMTRENMTVGNKNKREMANTRDMRSCNPRTHLMNGQKNNGKTTLCQKNIRKTMSGLCGAVRVGKSRVAMSRKKNENSDCGEEKGEEPA